MTEHADFRMPTRGDTWSHYKGGYGSNYTIVGMSRDDEGHAVVVYTPSMWGLAQIAPLYNQRLGRFVQEVDLGKPRFKFLAANDADDRCQYIGPVSTSGSRDNG